MHACHCAGRPITVSRSTKYTRVNSRTTRPRSDGTTITTCMRLPSWPRVVRCPLPPGLRLEISIPSPEEPSRRGLLPATRESIRYGHILQGGVLLISPVVVNRCQLAPLLATYRPARLAVGTPGMQLHAYQHLPRRPHVSKAHARSVDS